MTNQTTQENPETTATENVEAIEVIENVEQTVSEEPVVIPDNTAMDVVVPTEGDNNDTPKTEQVECMYCGKLIAQLDAVVDQYEKTFCTTEHKEIYAHTMRRINNNY